MTVFFGFEDDLTPEQRIHLQKFLHIWLMLQNDMPPAEKQISQDTHTYASRRDSKLGKVAVYALKRWAEDWVITFELVGSGMWTTLGHNYYRITLHSSRDLSIYESHRVEMDDPAAETFVINMVRQILEENPGGLRAP